jgi:hypothetical protein
MELLGRFARGDVEVFESLFQRHQGEVYIYRAHARFDPSRSFGACQKPARGRVPGDPRGRGADPGS